MGAVGFKKCSPGESKRCEGGAGTTRTDVTANSTGQSRNTTSNETNDTHPRQKKQASRLVFDTWQFGGKQFWFEDW